MTVTFIIPRERPKVVVKADLLPGVTVLSMVGMLGIPLGWLWAQLAPPQRSRVLADGALQPLPLESWHSFDALVIFGLLLFVAGLFAGGLTWLLRERRGPLIMFATVLGSALAGWLAVMMGNAFTAGKYTIDEPPAVDDIIDVAPELSSMWVLVLMPLATALVYGLLAAWNGNDDLGRRLG